jgi:hypothetical protein
LNGSYLALFPTHNEQSQSAKTGPTVTPNLCLQNERLLPFGYWVDNQHIKLLPIKQVA